MTNQDTVQDRTTTIVGDAIDSVRKRRGKKSLVILAIALSVTILAAAAWGAVGLRRSAQQTANVDKHKIKRHNYLVELKEKGELKAARSVDIKCEVQGRPTIISIIDEGTEVKEGDLLIELASDQLDDRIQQDELKEATVLTAYEAAKTDLDIQQNKNASDVRKADLKMELNRLELEKYTEGEWPQKLRDADIAIEQAEITLQRRTEDYEAAKKLQKKGYNTLIQFKNDEFEHTRAKWDLEKAKKSKEVLLNYTHVADLQKKESDYQEAIEELTRVKKNAESEEARKTRNLAGKEKELELTRTQLAKLRQQKDKCNITAPAPGFVVYYVPGGHFFSFDGSGQIKEGATVRERQVLMQLPDTSQMQVVIRIPEAKTDRIEIGQSAVIEVEGVPGQQFKGTVTKIAVLADTQNRWLNPDLKEYETEITLEPSDIPLKPGATAHVRVLVEQVIDTLAVPVQSVYTQGGKRYVFKVDGGEVEPVEVQLGAVGVEWAAISGEQIGEHDEILLAFSEIETRLIPDVTEMSTDVTAAGTVSVTAAGDRSAVSKGSGQAPGNRSRQHGEGKRKGRRGRRSSGASESP